MSEPARKSDPTDLTDEQWQLIEPLLPAQRKSPKGGRVRAVDMREVVNTILYQCPPGCQWNMLPHNLLPRSTVYDYFAKWGDDWKALAKTAPDSADEARSSGPVATHYRRQRQHRSDAVAFIRHES